MTRRAPPLPDQEARLAALEPSRSFIVQAPAGSGKTGLLVQRYLALLARVGAPEEIVAITFTRKAAAEMRLRVLSALEEAARGGEPATSDHERRTRELARAAAQRAEARGWRLAEQPSRLRIETIDALQLALARRMPWMSRFGAPPAATDDARPLYDEAARRAMAALSDARRPDHAGAIATVLDHLDADTGSFRALLASMLGKRDQWLRHAADPDRAAEPLRRAVVRFVRDQLASLEQRVAAPPLTGLVEELRELAVYATDHLQPGNELRDGLARWAACASSLGAIEDGPASVEARRKAWCALASWLLTKDGTWRKPGGVNRTIGFPAAKDDACKKRFQQLLERLASSDEAGEALCAELERVGALPDCERFDPGLAAAVLQVLLRAAAELRVVFAERGEVDFIEIALAARTALGDADAPTDLALALDARVEHILVDEFQDTSRSQFELIARLTAGWEPGDGRTLFLVGDPMQSIYRFREADVGLFLEAARGRLGDVGLAPLRLTTNFRSGAGLVRWYNELFGDLFANADDPETGAVRYTPCEAAGGRGPGRAEVLLVRAGRRDDVAEAELARRLVEQALASGCETRVAILGRARAHLTAVGQALRAAGIGFTAVELDALGERQEVLDLAALASVLAHPGDRASWLALLRAPWCGLTLADLERLAGGDDAPFADRLADAAVLRELSEEGRRRATRLGDTLAPFLDRRGRVGFARLVEGAWLALGGPSGLADAAARDAVEQAFERLRRIERAGDLDDPREIVRALSDSYAAPRAAGGERVELMTIHKAKGLEFDVVIVPGIDRAPRHEERTLLRWTERTTAAGGDADLLLAPLDKRGKDTASLYRSLRALDRQREDNEAVRLLYVAATRARERLVLLGVRIVGDDGSPRPAAPRSFLKRLEDARRPDWDGFEEVAPAPPPTAAGASIDARTALVRRREPIAPVALPAGIAPSPGARATPPSEVAEPTFDWASETARAVGVVAHRFLQQIGRESLAAFSPERLRASAPLMRALLAREGVGPDRIAAAVARVTRALERVLEDERGRWLFDPSHTGVRVEWELAGLHEGRVRRGIVDRSFVTAEGVRWIVDFKTGHHEGGDAERFLDAEQRRYRAQLEAYAEIVRGLESRPIRLGLYFPLVRGGWREWAPPG